MSDHHNTLIEESRAKHHRQMRNSLILAVLFGLLGIFLVYSFVTSFDYCPVYLLYFISLGIFFCLFIVSGAIFEAGCEYEKKRSEPELLAKDKLRAELVSVFQASEESKNREHSKLWERHSEFVSYVKRRAPHILHEVAERRAKRKAKKLTEQN